MSRKIERMVISLMLASALYLSGCSSNQEPPQDARFGSREQATNTSLTSDEEHAHEPGAHGGIIVAIGRDSYHVEAVFEKGGLLRLYTLGSDESRVQEVEQQTPTAYVKVDGAMESTSVLLKPEPQDGDSEGKTSQFVGRLPKEFEGTPLAVTIPSIRINGARFRLGFKSASEQHQEAMPDQLADAKERDICLAPGGKYTAEDIKANGNVLPSQKYRGVMFPHAEPKDGDTTCPIGKSKASPNCAWVIGGKTYHFC